MIRKLIFALTLILSLNSVFSSIQITEMKPQGAEFLEVYSTSIEDFSTGKIFDSSGSDSFNTLEKIKSSNSNLSLFVGSRFIEEYDIDSLNCNIYLTSTTQVSKGGLLSQGEKITIQILNSTSNSSNIINITWIPQKDFDLNSSSSIDTQFQTINSQTPCEYNNLPNMQNQTQETPISFPICSCPTFSINSSKELVNDTIEYEFITNSQDGIVEYWVESYNSSIVKDKLNTSIFSTKYYTPSKIGVYTIKARLLNSQCEVFDEFEVIYYKQEEKSNSIFENSSIIIENEELLETTIEKTIDYEISRGNTLKRVVKFFIGNEELAALYLNKYSSIKGKLLIPSNRPSNTLFIEGLGINKTISLKEVSSSSKEKQSTSTSSSSNSKSSTQNTFDENSYASNAKLQVLFDDFKQVRNNFTFSAKGTHKGDLNCYIVKDRTKFSNEISTKISLEKKYFNLTLLEEKLLDTNNNKNLELFCKFKKENLKTYDSSRIDIVLDSSQILTNSEISNNQNNNSQRTQHIKNDIEENDYSKIQTKQIDLKEKVIYVVLGILIIIICLFLIFKN